MCKHLRGTPLQHSCNVLCNVMLTKHLQENIATMGLLPFTVAEQWCNACGWLLLLQVPWSNLGQQPVVAELDRLFLVAGPKEDDSTKQQDGSSPTAASNPEQLERSAKSQRVAAAEAAWLKVGREHAAKMQRLTR
jgi:hypothetical protein